MNNKRYYQIQLESFTKLKEKCTNKLTLKKIDKVISKYQQIIENYDSLHQYVSEELCHCPICTMQG